MRIIITVAAAITGGFFLQRLKVPAGILLGAVAGVAALNIVTGYAYIWPQVRIVSQVLAGAYIGCMVTKRDLRLLPRIIGPYFTIVGRFLVLNLVVAYFIRRVTDLDPITCMLSAMPGGMSDSPLIAMDMGADCSVVVLLQFIRVIFGLACLPSLICLADRIIEPKPAQDTGKIARDKSGRARAADNMAWIPFMPTLCVALAAGMLGYYSGIPAGTLSFSMLSVAAMNIAGKVPPMPARLHQVSQLLCGCCIGLTVELEQLLRIPQLILPAIVLCMGYLVCCVGQGMVISRVFKFPFREAMLFLSPAGAVEMTFIAADLGVESTALPLLQILRLVSVVLLFPQVFHLIANLL